MRAQPQEVIQNTGDFIEHHADVLCPLGHIHAHQFFNRHHIGVFVDHHRYIIETIHIRQILNVGAGLGEFFSGAMQQADMRVGALHDLAIELQHQPQHAVRRRMLGTKVHRVILDFWHDYFRPA